MFKGKKKKHINPSITDTLIGEGSIFEGHIKSEASIRVEGKINGDIQCTGDVIIGEGGHAKSTVQARNITIAGTVTGNVTAKEKLIITSSGKLLGNAKVAGSFIIDEGGLFTGMSKMEPKTVSKNKNQEDPPDHQDNGNDGLKHPTAANMM